VHYAEYGAAHQQVVVLLHGGGLSWWNYREAAERLQAEYRVILPVLDGHAGSDAPFTTMEANAARLIAFIDEHFGGQVLLIGGLSLGGQVLLEMLSQRRDICRYALIESALTEPSRLTHALIRPAFGSCYGLIRRRWFARLQFASLRIKRSLFEDYYRDTCRISQADMIAFMQANAMYALKDAVGDCAAKVHVVVGGRENGAMRRSARAIHRKLPGSTFRVLPGLHHGELSINHAHDYADMLIRLVTER